MFPFDWIHTKLKTTDIKTGPLSLEMLNHAASDFNNKGVINLNSAINI